MHLLIINKIYIVLKYLNQNNININKKKNYFKIILKMIIVLMKEKQIILIQIYLIMFIIKQLMLKNQLQLIKLMQIGKIIMKIL